MNYELYSSQLVHKLELGECMMSAVSSVACSCISLRREDRCIILHPTRNQNVGLHDIVVPDWVHYALGTQNGDIVQVESIECDGEKNYNGILQLEVLEWLDVDLGLKSTLPITSSSTNQTHSTPTPNRNSFLTSRALTRMLPSFLHGRSFVDEGFIGLNLLDSILILKVFIDDADGGDEEPLAKAKALESKRNKIYRSCSTTVKLKLQFDDMKSLCSSSSSERKEEEKRGRGGGGGGGERKDGKVGKMGFSENTYNEISISDKITDTILSSLSSSSSIFPSSILIVGAHGMGKSHTVANIIDVVSTVGAYCVNKIDTASIVRLQSEISSDLQLDSLHLVEEEEEEDCSFQLNLRSLFRRIGINVEKSGNGLLLVWENIEDLIQVDNSTEDSVSAIITPGLIYAASLLRDLTSAIEALRLQPSISKHSKIKIPNNIVLLCTANVAGEKNISSRFARPPGFHSVFKLPRPTIIERESIIHNMLSKLITQHSLLLQDIRYGFDSGSLIDGSKAEAESKSKESETVVLVQEWARRLAGVTPGRIPRDLFQLLRRAMAASTATWTINQRSKGISSSHDKCIFLWKAALEAASSQLPQALQLLEQIIPATSKSSGKSSKFEFEMFGGYVEQINDLRCMLSRLKYSSSSLPSARSSIFKLSVPRGIVISGGRGCGKTFLAKIIASECGLNTILISSTDLLSKWFGETESKLRQLFHSAREVAPCAIVIDEFDSIACRRSSGDDGSGSGLTGSLGARVLSTLLNELDGISSSSSSSSSSTNSSLSTAENRILVIVTTSSPALLDEALLRPGRLDYHIDLPLPTRTDIYNILKTRCSHMALDDDVDLFYIAAELKRINSICTGADIDALCHKALMSSIKYSVASGVQNIKVSLLHFKLCLI